jgi:hypothetical protein
MHTHLQKSFWEARMRKAIAVGSLALLLGVGVVGCSDGGGTEGVLPGVNALVFARRPYISADGSHNLGGMGNVFDYLRYEPGNGEGGVFVLEPPTPDGTLRNLTEDFEMVDISGLDLSFDAKQVVFSMRHAGDDLYHIYIANIDGTSVRQLSFGPTNDVIPAWLAGDRIVFLTDEPYSEMNVRRADEYQRGGASQIATMSISGGDATRRLCSQNLSHSTNVAAMSDGRVLFSRWEHLGNRNDLKVFAMNPDCTNMLAIAGEFGKGFNSFVQPIEYAPGQIMGIATSREGTFQAGAIVLADARSRTSADPGRLDVQQVDWEYLTPMVPTDMGSPPSNIGRYRAPRRIFGRDVQTDLVITSWANGDVNERLEVTETAPNFGIYMWDPETQEKTLVYDNASTWDLYAIPVIERDPPPRRGDFRGDDYDLETPATIGSVDVTQTSLEESIAGGQFGEGLPLGEALAHTTRMRIIEGFSAEIGPVNMFGLTMHEGAAIVGEVPVHEDFSWEAQVAPYIPYHLQPIDEFGMSIRSQGLWIQAMPGEDRRCGGCHESRSGAAILPRNGATTIAQQEGPTDAFNDIRDRIELGWDEATYSINVHNDMQALFDAKCVSCHDGGMDDPYAGMSYTVETTLEDGTMVTAEIPYLELTDRPITVAYDNMVATYPASYVTLAYPGAMMGDVMITGTVPPQWMIPAEARRSRLIEVVNAQSEADPTRWAFPTAAHPENHGEPALSREERMMMIRSIDLGVQYWSRQNVEGAATRY